MAFKKKSAEGENPTDEQTEVETLKVKKVRIVIDEQDNWDKNNDVFVSVNGNAYLVKRGKEVAVPESVVNVLKEAVIIQLEKDRDGNEVERTIPRFALRILGEA